MAGSPQPYLQWLSMSNAEAKKRVSLGLLLLPYDAMSDGNVFEPSCLQTCLQAQLAWLTGK